MSTATTSLQTGNQLYVNYDYSKVFIGKNTFESATFNNATGGSLTYPIGTLLGRVSASGKVIPLASGATDGSKFPVGILGQTITVAGGADELISMAVSGEVDINKVTLAGADTMNTVISDRRLLDRIPADTLGIKLISADELTAFGNS